MLHPPLDAVRVLYRPGSPDAILYRMVKGKNVYERITCDQLLGLLESAAEALRKMRNGRPEEWP